MFPNHVNTATDSASDLEGTLAIIQGSGGGASVVVVELRNRSADRDVVLKVNTQLSAVIMLTATDQRGVILSTPPRRFDSSEVQRFETVRIGRASLHRWRVPVVTQLPVGAIPEQGVQGRLVVNVALQFSTVIGDEEPADDVFERSLLTLYDMDVRFTRAALHEGAEPAATDP